MNVQHRIKNIFKNSDEVASDKIAKRVYFDIHSVSGAEYQFHICLPLLSLPAFLVKKRPVKIPG